MADKRRYIRWTILNNYDIADDGLNLKYDGEIFDPKLLEPISITSDGLVYYYDTNDYLMQASLYTIEPKLRYYLNSGYYRNVMYNASYWLDENKGYIGGTYSLFYTEDAAQTVRTVYESETANFNGIFFLNQSTGYAFGENGLIIKTNNSGRSWTQELTATTATLQRMYANDENDIVCVGNSGVILRYTGGTEWHSLSTTKRNITNTATTVNITSAAYELHFINSGVGFASCASGYVLKTTDGGNTWYYSNPSTVSLFGLYAKNENEIWVCGANKTLLKSEDGCLTWVSKTGITFECCPTQTYGKICFSGDTGYMIGYDLALKTTDNGETWNKISYPTGYPVQGNITMFSDSKLYTTNQRGDSLSISTDGGDTWGSRIQTTYNYCGTSKAQIVSDNHILFGPNSWISSNFYEYYNNTLIEHNFGESAHSTYFLKEGDTIYGWLTNTTGWVYRTTDSLQNWETIGHIDFSKMTSAPSPAMYFCNSEIGFIGFGTSLFKTIDGGSGWTYIGNSWGSIRQFYFINTEVGWASTTTGKVNYTTDGGLSWTQVSTPGSGSIAGLEFLNSDIGFCCGSGGLLAKTIDGGLSWTQLTSTTSNLLRDVAIIDEKNIWCCGDGAIIRYTINGGETWKTYDTTGIYQNFYSIKFYNKIGYVFGSNRTIIKLG